MATRDRILKLRVTAVEMGAILEGARAVGMTMSEWVRGELQLDDRTAVLSDPERFEVVSVEPPVEKAEIVPEDAVSGGVRAGFRRSPRCQNRRCERLRTACCEECRKFNGKGGE